MTAPSARSRIRRVPSRADYQRETIDAILDEALVAHLGFAVEGQPYVIPTLHARVGDIVYIHGSAASRAIRALSGGLQACLTVTLLDGLVLARSAFHHSMNYRSVVVLGEARPVEGPEERLKALEAFTERLIPGRWDEVRWPSRQELKGTRVLALDLARGLGQGPHRPAGRRRRGLRDGRLGGRDPAHPAGRPADRRPEAPARHRALGGGAALAGLSAWLLGSGGWIPTGRRATTCVLVRRGDAALILDAGTGLHRLITEPSGSTA